MEAVPIKVAQAQPALDFALLRSDLLDAFSDLESEVSMILRSAGIAPSNEPFGNRLQKLKEADKIPRIARANRPARDQIVDSLAELLPIRADIVHSRMRLARLDDEPVALFINAQEAGTDYAPARVLTLTQMRQLVTLVNRLGKRIRDLGRTVNPASSPPPPLPGAAGDP